MKIKSKLTGEESVVSAKTWGQMGTLKKQDGFLVLEKGDKVPEEVNTTTPAVAKTTPRTSAGTDSTVEK